ncbi:hypothetical protein M1145_01975 [Patescibacteria group bacterium]|nr:hypothetical protein [Patescibacteria group bacterium]
MNEFEHYGLTITGSSSVERPSQNESLTRPSDIRECLFNQLRSAYSGYQAIEEHLMYSEDRRMTEDQVGNELHYWLTKRRLDLVFSAIEANPYLQFNLVAIPNVLASSNQITNLAREFSRNHLYETNIWNNFYSKYSAKELSGTRKDDENNVVFSLIPDKLNPTIYGTVQEIRGKLRELQQIYPEIRVPSVLESIAYWYILKAQNNNAIINFESTYIRHFDLPEKRFYAWKCVPDTFIDNNGRPCMDNSNIDHPSYARIAIG